MTGLLEPSKPEENRTFHSRKYVNVWALKDISTRRYRDLSLILTPVFLAFY